MLSYCAIAVVYVDLVNQPITLCQLAKSMNHHYKNSEFVVEALFPTLRGFNPLAGDSSPAAEE